MKKMINLLFALLLSLSIISCGGSDGGGGSTGGSNVNLPGVKGGTDSTPKNPNAGNDVQTGTSSSAGCSEASLPGCKV